MDVYIHVLALPNRPSVTIPIILTQMETTSSQQSYEIGITS